MANYWDKQGGGGTQNPNAPKRPPKSPDQLVLAMRAAGQQPTQQQIDEAMAYVESQSDGRPTFNTASGLAPGLDPNVSQRETVRQDMLRANEDKGWGIPDSLMSGLSGISDSIGLGAKLGIGTLGQDVSKGASSAASGMFGGIAGIGKMVADAANASEGAGAGSSQYEDPEDIYARLRGQIPAYAYTGKSAEEMAAGEFGPQFKILDKIAKDQESRYSRGKGDIQGLYAALARDVDSSRGENAAAYKQAGAGIDQNNQAAVNSVSGAVKGNNDQMAKIMQLLGQGQAAPAVAKESNELLTRETGRITDAGRIDANLNKQLGTNTFAYDTQRGDNVRQAGVQSGQELLQQYLDQQTQNDMKRLDVQGQQGAQENKYELTIQDLLQKGSASREDAIGNAFKEMMGTRQSDQKNHLDTQKFNVGTELDQARLMLDTDRFGLDTQKFAADQNRNAETGLNPYQVLQSRASQLFQDPNRAKSTADTIMQAGLENPNAENLASLMGSLDPAWLSQPGNKELAYDYFTRILAANNKGR